MGQAKREETPEQSVTRLQAQREEDAKNPEQEFDPMAPVDHDLTPFEQSIYENITLKRALLDKDKEDLVRAIRRRLEVPDHFGTAFNILGTQMRILPKPEPKEE